MTYDVLATKMRAEATFVRMLRPLDMEADEHLVAYTGLDTRVSKTDSGGTTSYKRAGAYVTDSLLKSTVSSTTTDYTPGVSSRVGSDSTFLHSGIKNADTQTDDGGDVSAMRRYDAFGNPLAAWGGWQGPFGYGGPYGYQSDPDHGLMLLGHRYYEADTGRFLTRDPIKDGRNWYGYCGGNSLRYADPDGELPIIVASDGRLVYGYSDHAIDRAISRDGGRGVSPKAILDALKNPIKITPYPNNPTITNYHGRHAMVGVSQEGRITTTIGLSKSGARNPPPYSVNNRLRGLRVGMALFAIVEGASAAAAGMREVMLWHRRTRLQFGPIDGGSDEAADLALGVDPSYNEWDVSRF